MYGTHFPLSYYLCILLKQLFFLVFNFMHILAKSTSPNLISLHYINFILCPGWLLLKCLQELVWSTTDTSVQPGTWRDLSPVEKSLTNKGWVLVVKFPLFHFSDKWLEAYFTWFFIVAGSSYTYPSGNISLSTSLNKVFSFEILFSSIPNFLGSFYTVNDLFVSTCSCKYMFM